MPHRRKPYQRSIQPQPISITSRDKRILETIHAFDGIISLRQIDHLFFSGRYRSQPRARMRLLYDNAFVNMPGPENIHQVPIGETIYWLDREGAAVVAGLHGQSTKQFHWRSKPRYSLIEHDLRVNDFRIAMREACNWHSKLELVSWIPESEFIRSPDRITYETLSGKNAKRSVRPDGYFLLDRTARLGPTKQFAFLLEIDMGSEDNPRFAREKVRPGLAYIGSEQFAKRFGLRHGRYLVVSTGRRRIRNMKAQAERSGGKGLFYFSTFDKVTPESVLTEPIWMLAGHQDPRSIIPL